MKFIGQDKYKNDIGIYSITNILSGDQYIGQTGERFMRRYWHYRWKLRNGTHDNAHLQSAFNKYGEDAFVFEVIESVDDVNRLDELEIFYIEKNHSSYNILQGGGGRRGTPMCEHAKEIIGAKNREHMTGRKHSEETKNKMSESRRGQWYTRHGKTNVIAETEAEQIKKLLIGGKSVSAIAKDMSLPRGAVANILSNDTWDNVVVDGWYEFLTQREKSKRLHKDEVQDILSQYQQGKSISQLAVQYSRPEKAIKSLIMRHAA